MRIKKRNINNIKQMFLDCYGTLTKASRELGVSRQVIYNWINNGVCLNSCAWVAEELGVHPAKLNYVKIKQIVPELRPYEEL
jgi:DNA invertase Pin-like site-specific DNA recombinase